jgi:hypothetical protein
MRERRLRSVESDCLGVVVSISARPPRGCRIVGLLHPPVEKPTLCLTSAMITFARSSRTAADLTNVGDSQRD